MIVLRLAAARTLRIGRLGTYRCPGGYYTYVGSALGPGGLAARLKRHFKPVKRLHWHIDYLRRNARWDQVWFCFSRQRLEHRWASALAQLPGAAVPVPGFGASDCRCPRPPVLVPQPAQSRPFRQRPGR